MRGSWENIVVQRLIPPVAGIEKMVGAYALACLGTREADPRIFVCCRGLRPGDPPWAGHPRCHPCTRYSGLAKKVSSTTRMWLRCAMGLKMYGTSRWGYAAAVAVDVEQLKGEWARSAGRNTDRCRNATILDPWRGEGGASEAFSSDCLQVVAK